MSRIEATGDNAAVESVVALLQKNVLNGYLWTTRALPRIAIAGSNDRNYHRRGRQARLSRLPPIEYGATTGWNY